MKRNATATKTATEKDCEATINDDLAFRRSKMIAAIEKDGRCIDDPETTAAKFRDAMEAVATIIGNMGNPIALAESMRVDAATNPKMVAVENLLNPKSAMEILLLDLRDGCDVGSRFDKIAVTFGDALKKCAMGYPSISISNPCGDPGCNLQSARSALSKLHTNNGHLIDSLSVDAELDHIGYLNEFRSWEMQYRDEIENGERLLTAILNGLDAFSAALYKIGNAVTIGGDGNRGKWMDNLIDKIDQGKSITITDGHKTLSMKGIIQWKIINALYSTDDPKGWVDLTPIIGNCDARVFFKFGDAKELARWIERDDRHYRFNAPKKNSLRKR